MPKGTCRLFLARVHSLHRFAVTGRQVAFVLVGVAGNTGFRADVFDGRIRVEGWRRVQLCRTQDMERKTAQQDLQCLAAIAESGREVLIHGIVLKMAAGLFCWEEPSALSLPSRNKVHATISRLNRGLSSGLLTHGVRKTSAVTVRGIYQVRRSTSADGMKSRKLSIASSLLSDPLKNRRLKASG